MNEIATKIEVDHALMAKLFGTAYNPQEDEYSQEIVLQDPHGCFGYVVVWAKSKTYVTAKAFEITSELVGAGEDGQDQWLVQKKDGKGSDDTTTDLAEAEVQLDMSVKWDGCMNIWYKDYRHFCGLDQLQKSMAIQCHVYMIARAHLLKDVTEEWRRNFLPPWGS